MADLPATAFVEGFDDEPSLEKLQEWRRMLVVDAIKPARGVTKEQALVWLDTAIAHAEKTT